MKIRLQELEHHKKALQACGHIFDGLEVREAGDNYSNPTIDITDKIVFQNIESIQKGNLSGLNALPRELWSIEKTEQSLVIDVKMETGTGKTCVYTQLMYELQKRHGFNKFVIAVPSIPIREGVRSFISSTYAKEFFGKLYPDIFLDLKVFEAQKSSQKKKNFPTVVREFFEATKHHSNKINTLLVGQGMIKDSAAMGRDFDVSLVDKFSKPHEAIAATRPILIIDEPHRFKRSDTTYKYLLEKFKPQIIFRFGATFPDKTGKKNSGRDYANLVHNLDSCASFNQNLIKGVAVEYLEKTSEGSTHKIKVLEVKNGALGNKYVKLRNESNKKDYTLKVTDDLGMIDERLSNLSIVAIGKFDEGTGVKLSNDQILYKDLSFDPLVYGLSYQEKMLELALDRHFEAELSNFKKENKIKTLALFFIDNISSYRNDTNDGVLKQKFEAILKKKLENQIKIVKSDEYLIEYVQYLQASLANITKTNGGYFAKDNSSSDEVIKEEIDNILKNKEKLLSIKDKDGNFNLLRFIFSKWTLREGWDNPNVFTIAKLRSSGSDISKLQEVGRGLRLPVDESGQRITSEQSYLNYIVDYSEKEFANKLLYEINTEVYADVSCKDFLVEYAEKHGIDFFELFCELGKKGYIDKDCKINEEKRNEFFREYPEFKLGLQPDKIINKNKKENPNVGIIGKKFEEIKELWQAINAKYYISYEKIDSDALQNGIVEILSKIGQKQSVITSIRNITKATEGSVTLMEGDVKTYEDPKLLPYNEFLMAVYNRCHIPIQQMHTAILEYDKKSNVEDSFFTYGRLNHFILAYSEWAKNALNKYEYKKLDISLGETALTDRNGKVKESILRANVGVKLLADYNCNNSKFLYELPLYDSELEAKNIKQSDGIDEVVVFGKIPRRSVKIPLYFGGTYSPDFMYVLKNKNGNISLNCIIETKDVQNESDLRGDEKLKIACAKKFYETLSKDLADKNIHVHFKEQLAKDEIASVIRSFAVSS